MTECQFWADVEFRLEKLLGSRNNKQESKEKLKKNKKISTSFQNVYWALADPVQASYQFWRQEKMMEHEIQDELPKLPFRHIQRTQIPDQTI